MRLIAAILLLCTAARAQDYTAANRQGVLGQMYNEQGKYDSAEKYLRKALYLMPDKRRFGCYFFLIKFANSHNDTARLAEYFTELSCIYPKDSILPNLSRYVQVNIDESLFNQLYRPRCILTKEYIEDNRHTAVVDSIISSLSTRDQSMRSMYKRQRHMTVAEMDAHEKRMHEIDSTNFLKLLHCIEKYGFPDLDGTLGWSRSTIIVHIDNYANFQKIQPYLLTAVQQGKFAAISYAYAMDRSLIASGLPPRYYWLIPGTQVADAHTPSKEELAQVNRDRYALGLPPYPMWTGWGF